MRIAERIFNRPLMISEMKFNTILQVFGERHGLALQGVPAVNLAEISDAGQAPAGYSVRSGIAVVAVHGPLMHRVMEMEFPSGGPMTYGEIRSAFDRALADPSVKGIVFDIDSPGGEVNGCFDLGDHIFASRGIKPITALVNEQAFSAAYLLASACDRIVLPRTGAVGSVGVIATHTEISGWEKANGIVVTHVYAGARKADLSSHTPLSGEAAGVLQGLVDDSYLLFVETVARNLGLPVQQIVETEAAIYEGQKAVKAGLAHEVSAIEPARLALANKPSNRLITASAPIAAVRKESKKMNLEELQAQHPALVAQIETAARQGMVALSAVDTARAEATAAETARVMAVVSAVVGEDTGKKLETIVAAKLTAEQLETLGVSLAPAAPGATEKQMLEAITAAASPGVGALAVKGTDAEARTSAVSAIAAGGSKK
jgi:signal peptide peptidase SppA